MNKLQQSINELSASIDKNIELLAKQREEIMALRTKLAKCEGFLESMSITANDMFHKRMCKEMAQEINETLKKEDL